MGRFPQPTPAVALAEPESVAGTLAELLAEIPGGGTIEFRLTNGGRGLMVLIHGSHDGTLVSHSRVLDLVHVKHDRTWPVLQQMVQEVKSKYT